MNEHFCTDTNNDNISTDTVKHIASIAAEVFLIKVFDPKKQHDYAEISYTW